MKVFLRKDIEGIGAAGEIIKVNDGYGRNFLIPRGLAQEVTAENEASFEKRKKVVENRKVVIATKTSLLAEKIAGIKVVLKRKVHDDGKLYGAINANEVVDALAQKGISVSKRQVVFDKSIKEKGVHAVTIALTSRLQPTITVDVIAL